MSIPHDVDIAGMWLGDGHLVGVAMSLGLRGVTCELLEDNESQDMCNVFDEKGAEVDFIELSAELEERLIRNRTSKRLLEKPSKRDIEKSEARLLEMENQHKMNSDGAIPLPERHLIINNTNRTAADVANEIIETLRIPRRTQVC